MKSINILSVIVILIFVTSCDFQNPEIKDVKISKKDIVHGETFFVSFNTYDNVELKDYDVTFGTTLLKGSLSGTEATIENIAINTKDFSGHSKITISVRDISGNENKYLSENIEVTLRPTPKVIKIEALSQSGIMNKPVSFIVETDIPAKEVSLKWLYMLSSMQGSGTKWSITVTPPVKADSYKMNYTAFSEGSYGFIEESETKHILINKK